MAGEEKEAKAGEAAELAAFPSEEELSGADPDTLATWLPELYEELRRLAAGYLRSERANHTLQPTALVHEAYLRLADQPEVHWRNRAHLLGIAARMMRRVLINYAAARTAEKRGGKAPIRLTLDAAMDLYQREDVSLAAIDEALRELELLDPRQAQIVELRFFGGLTTEEIARALRISPATIKREWATAKPWLQQQLSQNLD